MYFNILILLTIIYYFVFFNVIYASVTTWTRYIGFITSVFKDYIFFKFVHFRIFDFIALWMIHRSTMISWGVKWVFIFQVIIIIFLFWFIQMIFLFFNKFEVIWVTTLLLVVFILIPWNLLWGFVLRLFRPYIYIIVFFWWFYFMEIVIILNITRPLEVRFQNNIRRVIPILLKNSSVR